MDPGQTAIDFTLNDQDGAPVTLSALWKQGPVVLFFYPKDDTPGCTAEVCGFRDSYEAFRTAGASIIGISSQGQASKKKFSEKHQLPFKVVTDEGGTVRKQYGVKGALLGLIDGRETFIIDRHGVVQHRFNSMTNIGQHIKQSLDMVGKLATAA